MLALANKPSFEFRRGIFLVLFIGYLVLGLLVAQQGRVIDSQKHLIRLLFRDSMELTAMRIHNAQPQDQKR